MRITCAHPTCETKSPEVPWWNMLLTCITFAVVSFGDYHWWICEEHRYTEAEWDDLHEELKRTGKLS